MSQKRPKTEYQKEKARQYKRRYIKEHKEDIKRHYSKYDRTHREHRNRHYREKWNNDPALRERRKAYFKQLALSGRRQIYTNRDVMKRRLKDRSLHVSSKLMMRLSIILNLIKPDDIKGATDLRYWEQIRLRLEASKLLAREWNKSFKSMGGKEEIQLNRKI